MRRWTSALSARSRRLRRSAWWFFAVCGLRGLMAAKRKSLRANHPEAVRAERGPGRSSLSGLAPETVRALDAEAARRGLSRSATIEALVRREVKSPTPREDGAYFEPSGISGGFEPFEDFRVFHLERFAATSAATGRQPGMTWRWPRHDSNLRPGR